MIKKISKSLSIKVFFITAGLLILACSGTFFCVSQLLHSSYISVIDQNLENNATKLVDELSKKERIEDCFALVEQFKKETSESIWFEDKNGKTVSLNGKEQTADAPSHYTPSGISADVNMAQGTQAFSFTLKNGETYNLCVQANMREINQALEILSSIFPYVILIILVLSLLCAAFYSNYITRPIVRLNTISQNMANLNFSDQCNEKRKDELGRLAKNLNSLSSSLSSSIHELEHTNAQLKSDMERDREIERSRIDFFAAASHELKTPLTILKGHIAGMADGIGGYEDHKKYLKRSLAVTEQMESLVGELLFVSRMESRAKSITLEQADISEIIRTQLAVLTDLMKVKNLSITINMPEKLFCYFNKQQMIRVIQNLLMNAIRYSPEGEEIRISLTKKARVECMIENTGTHIPDQSIPHLFDAFYRSDHSRTRSTGGTGLGLYIVRGILENHQAVYRIENTTDGVQFFFALEDSDRK